MSSSEQRSKRSSGKRSSSSRCRRRPSSSTAVSELTSGLPPRLASSSSASSSGTDRSSRGGESCSDSGSFSTGDSNYTGSTGHIEPTQRSTALSYSSLDDTQLSPSTVSEPERPNVLRRLLLVREAERTDRIFGSKWHKLAWKAGVYRPYNLNMPMRLPLVNDASHHYGQDSPLTSYGGHESTRVGGALKRAIGSPITTVYSSPAFSCVATAQRIIFGAGWHKETKIRIEPGLYTWLGGVANTKAVVPPRWISPESYARLGFSIDLAFEPLYPSDALSLSESVQDYYDRVAAVRACILCELTTATPAGVAQEATTAVVSDAATMDAVVCAFTTAAAPRDAGVVQRQQLKYPCVSMLAFERRDADATSADGRREWTPTASLLPPHSVQGVSNRIDHGVFAHNGLVPVNDQ